ncbi:MAG: hypothetical protein AAFR79_06120 [Pseudomonadota bacterium]
MTTTRWWARCVAAGAVALGLAHGSAEAVAVSVNPVLPNQNALAVPSFGDFNIALTFLDSTGAVSSPGAQIEGIFNNAVTFWEGQIAGYRDPGLAADIPFLEIDVTIDAIDGVSNILGFAGPTVATVSGGFVTPNAGQITLDVDDINNFLSFQGGIDFIEAVAIHEMAHVMGFVPSVWDLNGVVANEVDGFFTEYTGFYGLQAYNTEFAAELGGPVAFIPLEDAGGPGTQGAHWDEQGFANFSLLNGTNANVNPEIMTGFLNNANYLSQTTRWSFQDIGYAVLPLPAAGWMLLAALGVLFSVGHVRRA